VEGNDRGQFKILYRHLTGGTEENHDRKHNSRSSDRYSNRTLFKHKSETVSLKSSWSAENETWNFLYKTQKHSSEYFIMWTRTSNIRATQPLRNMNGGSTKQAAPWPGSHALTAVCCFDDMHVGLSSWHLFTVTEIIMNTLAVIVSTRNDSTMLLRKLIWLPAIAITILDLFLGLFTTSFIIHVP
jgi:hypothetical protein